PGVADAEHFDRMAAAAQHLLRAARPETCDQASDLAGTDIERANDRGPPRRKRPHFRCEAVLERAHASPPFFFGGLRASSRACAAASERRTAIRSGKRRSIARMSRLSTCRSRSSVARISSADPASISGKRTSTLFLSLRFQRRSPTSTL